MMKIENNKTEEEIEIPSGLLKALVAEDIRDEKISFLEDAEDNEILGLNPSKE